MQWTFGAKTFKAKTEPKRKTADRFAVLNAFVDTTLAELSRSEIAVWFVLYRDTRNGTVRTSQANIARRAGMSVRSVGKAIATPTAFGSWLCGCRLDGRRKSQTGDRRLTSNPFEGFGKKSERDDGRRIARALTLDEMLRLLEQARRRPLDDALRVRRGEIIGQRVANVSDERRADLERLGHKRALIYKTLILTGLRKNELRTLSVGDLSFGDVPFLVLRAKNEKKRKGSTVPLRLVAIHNFSKTVGSQSNDRAGIADSICGRWRCPERTRHS